ncbi:hypothetical protein [Streptomyces atratus]
MKLHQTWYALALARAFRTLAVCFEAVVRRSDRIGLCPCGPRPTPLPLRPVRLARRQPGAALARRQGLPRATAVGPGVAWRSQ